MKTLLVEIPRIGSVGFTVDDHEVDIRYNWLRGLEFWFFNPALGISKKEGEKYKDVTACRIAHRTKIATFLKGRKTIGSVIFDECEIAEWKEP